MTLDTHMILRRERRAPGAPSPFVSIRVHSWFQCSSVKSRLFSRPHMKSCAASARLSA